MARCAPGFGNEEFTARRRRRSTANWNYLTQPFSFTYPGVDVHEIEPWHRERRSWRRQAVRFPETNAKPSDGQKAAQWRNGYGARSPR